MTKALQRADRIKLIAAFAVMYVVWSTTYLAIKVGLDADLPPTLFSGLRLFPAGLILLAFARARGTAVTVSRPQLKIVAIVGVLLLAGGQYGTVLAERYIPSGIAALVVAVVPLWIALSESALPDMQRPSRRGWIGLVIGFVGLGVLLLPKLTGVQAGGWLFGVGIAIQILATWLWSGGSIYSKRKPTGLDGIVSTGWQMLIAGGLLVVGGTALGEWPAFHLTPKGFAAIAYLTVFGSCIAFTAFTYALAHAPASKVMTYSYVNPVIAVAMGWLFGRLGIVPPEPVTLSTFVGMAIIVSGVALTTSAPTLPSRAASSHLPRQ